jgi:hypothetical protein
LEPNPNMNKPENLKIQVVNISELRNLVENSVRELSTGNSIPQQTLVADSPNSKLLALIATNCWKILQKISLDNQPREEVSKDDIKRILRYTTSILNDLNAEGIEIIDRTGQEFDYGLLGKVVTTTEQDGISKEIVTETLIPTVKHKGKIAQQGEINISIPKK